MSQNIKSVQVCVCVCVCVCLCVYVCVCVCVCVCVGYFTSFPPSLPLSFQYLCSVEPLLSESEHQEMQQLAKEFE